MNPHIAEIMAESRFHETARRTIQRSARRVQHLMDNRRCNFRCGARFMPLQFSSPFFFFFFLALRAFALKPGDLSRAFRYLTLRNLLLFFFALRTLALNRDLR